MSHHVNNFIADKAVKLDDLTVSEHLLDVEDWMTSFDLKKKNSTLNCIRIIINISGFHYQMIKVLPDSIVSLYSYTDVNQQLVLLRIWLSLLKVIYILSVLNFQYLLMTVEFQQPV